MYLLASQKLATNSNLINCKYNGNSNNNNTNLLHVNYYNLMQVDFCKESAHYKKKLSKNYQDKEESKRCQLPLLKL